MFYLTLFYGFWEGGNKGTVATVPMMANLEIKCPPSMFAGDTKLSDAGDTPERWEGIQRNLDKLEKWDHGNVKHFNKTKGWWQAWPGPSQAAAESGRAQ